MTCIKTLIPICIGIFAVVHKCFVTFLSEICELTGCNTCVPMVVICWLLLNAVILFSWWGQDFFKKELFPLIYKLNISMHKQQSQYSICKTKKKSALLYFITVVYTMYRTLFHALNNAYPTFSSSWNISSFYRWCEQFTYFSTISVK